MANTIAGSINKIELPNGNRYEIHDTRIGVSANEELNVDKDLILDGDLILSGILYGTKDIYIGDDVDSLQHKSDEYRVAVSSSDSGRLQLFANDSGRGLYAIDKNGTGRMILSIDANNMATLTECTIKDALHIKKETVNIEQSNNHVNENQINNTYFGINFVDVSNNSMGGFRTFAKTDGAVGVQMYAYNFINGSSPNAPYNGLLFQVDKDGNYYYSTEDPQAFRKMLGLSTDGAWPTIISNGSNIGIKNEDIDISEINCGISNTNNNFVSSSFNIRDNDDTVVASIFAGAFNTGVTGVKINLFNYANSTSSGSLVFSMEKDKNGNLTFNPGDPSKRAIREGLGLGNTIGALPIGNGGTGATTAADARTALGITPTNIGAVATSAIINIEHGGTNANSRKDAFSNLVFMEDNPIAVATNAANDTNTNWKSKGNGIAYFSNNALVQQQTQYGYVFNWSHGDKDILQEFWSSTTNKRYHRTITTATANTAMPSWTEMLDSDNYYNFATHPLYFDSSTWGAAYELFKKIGLHKQATFITNNNGTQLLTGSKLASGWLHGIITASQEGEYLILCSGSTGSAIYSWRIQGLTSATATPTIGSIYKLTGTAM